MKLYKTKEKEVFYYHLKNGEKRFMYRHLYYDLVGKRRERKKSGFKSLVEAQRELIKLQASLLENNQLQADKHDINVSQWLDIWFQTYSKEWAVTTRTSRKGYINNHIKRLIGDIKLKHLTKTMYTNKFINVLKEEGYKPRTIMIFHGILSIAINAAVEDDIIDRNRLKKVSVENTEKLSNFLTPQELNVFLDYAKRENDSHYTFILLLAYTGMRRGEALGLRWSDVNYTGNTISIKRTRDSYGTRKPKTNNSHRTILIDDVVLKHLKAYRVWCIQRKLEYGEKLGDNDYVLLSNEDTSPLSATSLIHFFDMIYKRMEKDKVKINRITPHGLRHTHCTILLSEGIQVQTIADRLGNTAEMIYKTYSHSFKELEEKAVSVFSQSLQNVAISVAEK